MATIIDGKKLAQEQRNKVREEVLLLKKKNIAPGIAVIIVGDDPASKVYVKNKRKACAEAGIESFEYTLPTNTSQKDLLNLIEKLNSDRKVHGILVQLPLPSHIDEQRILEAINPSKDVDGFHPLNMGKFLIGLPCFKPCTPAGIMALIDQAGFEIAGKHAVVVGRSKIVGKPAAIMLLERNATVTICHSKTRNLEKIIGEADIVVAAAGKPHMIKGNWIKKGALVIDVGINRDEKGRITGDVEFEAAAERAFAITPVPGGVGPMTIAMLLKNTLDAAKQQSR
jgi:methylenetetrahydrofolate dehydrogenase (NADP+)/methenyltetrahydrofolate cyclohydrolase